MSDCYEGERRQDYPDLRASIARIDERTIMILEGQKQLASKESVDHITGRFDRHIASHALWIGLSVTAVVGVGAALISMGCQF